MQEVEVPLSAGLQSFLTAGDLGAALQVFRLH